ncbi:putative disease resistance RPP13-like protein 1 [Citrus sinensis]|nr:putative disease resistance RPP13-like protein 1 [Citrus sinensis]
MAVGELLLSAFFQVIFDRLAPHGELLNFVRQLGGGVDSELKKWENTLTMIKAVLSDAEEKQLTDQAVKIWLDSLRDLAYDVEDILDVFATRALEHKLIAEHDHEASTSKVQRLLPVAFFRCFNRYTVKFNHSMRSSVKDITGRLEELCKQRIELGLQLTPGGASSNTAAQRRPPSSSVPTERTVFGRHQDKAKILEMVSANSPSGHANIAVIPIVGMGGIGKTTLAREVYNDKEVETFKFDIKAWVCVSEDFDVLSISRAILESITYSSCDLKALNEVQVQLKKAVDGKKIFLVLDDVWNEDYGLWEDLKAPLMGAAPNSKIVVTTRHSHVASTMEPTQQYNLRCLSDEDCWSLFMMHAFVSRDLTAQQISDLFRDKVVGKCRGLPLAAKALGGLLRYKFEEKELVFLWMAEGIIQQSRNNKNQPEVLGRKYFLDLVSRGQQVNVMTQLRPGKILSVLDLNKTCTDLFLGRPYTPKRVLPIKVWITLYKPSISPVLCRCGIRLGCYIHPPWGLSVLAESISSVQKSRHFSYNCSVNDGNNMLDVVHEVQHLRTFLPVSVSSSGRYDMNDLVVSNLLSKCGKLRVLSLSRSYITELPKGSMSGWKHLRYLNLSDTRIRNLPKPTCSLINLQVLLLRDCYYLLKLPSKLRNLINLRHLDIMGAYLIKEIPFGMKELKNLQALSNFIVGTDTKSSGLKDLKSLAFVGGELSISGLENVIDPWEASEAMLCEKQYLEALSLQWRSQLQWGSQFDDSRNESREELVLGKLKPCTSIKKLTIKGYGGKKIPSWIADPSFSKMEVLGLENCENCTSLPSFGLLSSLKHLTVKGLRKLKSMGYGEHCSNPFQSLETLWFEDLPEWEYWDTKFEENGVAGFSSLRELSILNCSKFSGILPLCKNSQLESLCIRYCDSLTFIARRKLPSSLKWLEIENCEKLESLPNDMHELNYLQHLCINRCPSIVRFPEEGFPTNLVELEIRRVDVKMYKAIIHWGLHRLTSLRRLWIEGCDDDEAECFPDEEMGMMLPTSLSYLNIIGFRNLKMLSSKGFQSLTSLEFLWIDDCPNLTSFPEAGLPSSILWLNIWSCPKLEKVCKWHTKEGSKIANIPRVCRDGQFV